MHEADLEKERVRLEVLRATGLLDSPPEREFEALVDLARSVTGCRYAAISLIDQDRQWFKAERNIGVPEMPREHAFCAIVVDRDEPLVVPDTRADPAFRDNPLVTSGPGLQFYAGLPIRARKRAEDPRVPLGTLCVADDQARDLSPHDLETLGRLALVAEEIIRARFAGMRAADLMVRHKQDLAEVTRLHRQLVQAERLMDIGSWRLVIDRKQLSWSDGVSAIYGLPAGHTPTLEGALDFYPPQSRAIIAAAVERAIADGTPFDVELDFVTASGEARRVRSVGECELAEGMPHALFGVFQDITEQHRTEQALRHSATIDELTGLANRAAFNVELDARIVQARAMGEPLALLLIDLDGFKGVNDRCGHLAGDEVLQTIASRLARHARAGCCPARLGGDEFVLMLDHPPGSTAFHATVETLLAELCLVVEDGDARLPVSGTIGISWFDGASTRRDMLNRADQALYAAKRERAGTARVFGSDVRFGPDEDCVRAAA